ncbi:MAG: DUF349 domain-containing protein [Gammaproteobacteria bacterium]
MFKRFFKPKWQSARSQDRLAAIDGLSLSFPDQAQILSDLAAKDEAADVRQAAALKLTDLSLLFQRVSSERDAQVRQVVESRFQELLADDQHSEALGRLLASSSDPQLCVQVASFAINDKHRNQAISQIREDTLLVCLIDSSRYHDTRIAAAENLQSIDHVEQAWQQIKNRDKVVARHLHTRLEEHKAAQQRQIDYQELITRLVAGMQTLAKSVWSHEYRGRYMGISQQWDALESPPEPDIVTQYRQAEKQVLEVINAQLRYAVEAEKQQQLVAAVNQLVLQAQQAPLEKLAATVDNIHTQFVAQQDSWNTSLKMIPAEKKLSQQYQQSCHAMDAALATAKTAAGFDSDQPSETPSEPVNDAQLQTRLKQIDGLLSGFEKTPTDEQPVFIQSLTETAKTLRKTLKIRQNEVATAITATEKQLHSLNASLNTGKWGPASTIFQRLSKKINALPQKEQAHFQARLNKAEERMQEIGDWKSYATAPKLEELCEQMEAVPGKEELSPRDRADWIKKLQGQWKDLGSSPESQKLWPRFKEAADKAYAPCAEYFSEQREKREANLALRKKTCEQLDSYLQTLDWSNPDWRLVEKTQRLAKKEWSQTRQVERKAAKPLDEKFTALMKQFDEKLNTEYAANVALKTELIEKAEALAEGEINEHVLNQAKRLQLAWKQVGVTRYRDDQKLWEAFNGYCRKIFQAHRDVKQQRYQESIAHVKQAKDLLNEMQTLAKKNELDETGFSALQDTYQALPEFPDRDKKYLQRDYQKASDAFDRLRTKLQNASANARFDDLRKRADICRQLNQLLYTTPADLDEQVKTLTAAWNDDIAEQKKDWVKRITARRDVLLKHLHEHNKPDAEKAEKQRRMLCIELEIIKDIETPEEDKSIRMAYQLEQLQKGLKPDIANRKDELIHDLEVQWLCAADTEPEIQAVLEERFYQVLKQK